MSEFDEHARKHLQAHIDAAGEKATITIPVKDLKRLLDAAELMNNIIDDYDTHGKPFEDFSRFFNLRTDWRNFYEHLRHLRSVSRSMWWLP